MLALEHSEGDYFRDNRYVQVPGIDNLSQLVPDAVHLTDGLWTVNNNFPKLASSAAHLFGHPQVWAEEGGGAGLDGKYQIDFQLVRGVNALQIRTPILRAPGASDPAAPPPAVPPQAPLIAWYANRSGYLMAIGRPAAQVALYHPGNSIWLGGEDAKEADASTTKLGWELLEHQVDWDYFDEQSLSSVATLGKGVFTNLSGQSYKAIVFPSMTVITRTALDRLRAFANSGGTVIFVGKTPRLILDKTFMDAKDAPDLSFAKLIEPSGDITAKVLAALPSPDVALNLRFPRLTYTHRTWRDADFYFFFNESDQPETRLATIAGRGHAQAWDLGTGEIHPITGAVTEKGFVQVPLVLGPYETKVVVLGPLPSNASAPEPNLKAGSDLADLNGEWTIDINGKTVTSTPKPWSELGAPASFAVPAKYRKQFTAPSVPPGKHPYLEITDLRDYARVTLNGKELPARAFQPYRWDLTGALHPGTNNIEIEVLSTLTTRFPGSPAATTPSPAGMLVPIKLVAY
jgi:hypothetical protein